MSCMFGNPPPPADPAIFAKGLEEAAALPPAPPIPPHGLFEAAGNALLEAVAVAVAVAVADGLAPVWGFFLLMTRKRVDPGVTTW